jgi:hypothetical protein
VRTIFIDITTVNDSEIYRLPEVQLQNTVNTLARVLSRLKKEEEARVLFEEGDSYEKLRAKRVSLPITKH